MPRNGKHLTKVIRMYNTGVLKRKKGCFKDEAACDICVSNEITLESG